MLSADNVGRLEKAGNDGDGLRFPEKRRRYLLLGQHQQVPKDFDGSLDSLNFVTLFLWSLERSQNAAYTQHLSQKNDRQ
jgi:hypothetical protein